MKTRKEQIESALKCLCDCSAIFIAGEAGYEEVDSCYDKWSARDVIFHIASWISYSRKKLESILDKGVGDGGVDVDAFNRSAWESGRGVPLDKAINFLNEERSRYAVIVSRFSKEDFERVDYPTGFNWPLWRYLFLDTIVHPVNHFVFHSLTREHFDAAASLLVKAEPWLHIFSDGSDSVFDLSEFSDDKRLIHTSAEALVSRYQDVPVIRSFAAINASGILKKLCRSYEESFTMLLALIEKTPQGLFDAKSGGFIFCQQLLHALNGSHYWMREEGQEYLFPFEGRCVYPDLDGSPESSVTREELLSYAHGVRLSYQKWLDGKTDSWLEAPSLSSGMCNADILAGQIRHVMYHVGHCEALLRENGYDTVPWVD